MEAQLARDVVQSFVLNSAGFVCVTAFRDAVIFDRGDESQTASISRKRCTSLHSSSLVSFADSGLALEGRVTRRNFARACSLTKRPCHRFATTNWVGGWESDFAPLVRRLKERQCNGLNGRRNRCCASTRMTRTPEKPFLPTGPGLSHTASFHISLGYFACLLSS